MPADTAVLDRALVVMAVCMVIQTAVVIGGAIAAVMAWRRTADALGDARHRAEEQVAELRGHLERMSATVDDAAQTLIRGSAAVEGVATDVRDAMSSVRSTVGNVASVVTPPRAALALGLLRGVQTWRKRRAAERAEPDATSQV